MTIPLLIYFLVIPPRRLLTCPALSECNPASQHPVCNLDGLRESYGHLRGGISESVTMA
jgi:hypothetical protein